MAGRDAGIYICIIIFWVGFSIFTLQIKEMDAEARSLQPNVKAVLLAKLREYKSDLDNLKTEVTKQTSNSNQVDTLPVCFMHRQLPFYLPTLLLFANTLVALAYDTDGNCNVIGTSRNT